MKLVWTCDLLWWSIESYRYDVVSEPCLVKRCSLCFTLLLSSSHHMLKASLIFRMRNAVEAMLISSTDTTNCVSKAVPSHHIPGKLVEGCSPKRDPCWGQQKVCWAEHSPDCQPPASWANKCVLFWVTTFWDIWLWSFIQLKHVGPSWLHNIYMSSPS